MTKNSPNVAKRMMKLLQSQDNPTEIDDGNLNCWIPIVGPLSSLFNEYFVSSVFDLWLLVKLDQQDIKVTCQIPSSATTTACSSTVPNSNPDSSTLSDSTTMEVSTRRRLLQTDLSSDSASSTKCSLPISLPPFNAATKITEIRSTILSRPQDRHF